MTIVDELQLIVNEGKQKQFNNLYIRTRLKESLQLYVLYFVYTSRKWQKMVFTGGTCLRHLYGLGRLSEDIDFDLPEPIETEQLAKEVDKFFKQRYLYRDLKIAIHQQGRQLLLKFPVMRKLGLASESESDWLYVKIDVSQMVKNGTKVITTAVSKNNLNFVARHYDLTTMMSNKMVAILERNLKIGKENRETIKGRDFFDLLWFMQRGEKPNLERIKVLLNKPNLNLKKLWEMIDEKVSLVQRKFKQDLERDLLPFLESEVFVRDYVTHYFDEYFRLRQQYDNFISENT